MSRKNPTAAELLVFADAQHSTFIMPRYFFLGLFFSLLSSDASATTEPAVANASPAAATVGAKLTELESRAATENSFPSPNPAFQREVVQLIEISTLSSGEDFFRAANLVASTSDFRSARMRYELMLAAVARGEKRAESLLADSWDMLLNTLGRPLRFDASGLVAKNPGNDAFSLDAAPVVIAEVWRHPEEARAAAANANNNAEVQQIVDADQAVRAHFEKLTQEELREMQNADQKRNVRIRAIVAEGGLHTPQDFANASLVLQHSAAFAGYQQAHELAVSALLLGDRKLGRWLVAATYDRMLNSVGHDQRFGTQGTIIAGKPILRETDESGICDEERLALGCPTLAAKKANFNTRGNQ